MKKRQLTRKEILTRAGIYAVLFLIIFIILWQILVGDSFADVFEKIF